METLHTNPTWMFLLSCVKIIHPALIDDMILSKKFKMEWPNDEKRPCINRYGSEWEPMSESCRVFYFLVQWIIVEWLKIYRGQWTWLRADQLGRTMAGAWQNEKNTRWYDLFLRRRDLCNTISIWVWAQTNEDTLNWKDKCCVNHRKNKHSLHYSYTALQQKGCPSWKSEGRPFCVKTKEESGKIYAFKRNALKSFLHERKFHCEN